jgi:hypothetical protein
LRWLRRKQAVVLRGKLEFHRDTRVVPRIRRGRTAGVIRWTPDEAVSSRNCVTRYYCWT